MEQEPRKATDVLLEIEAKLDALLKRLDASDLNIKVVSNKLNELMKGLEKIQSVPPQQKITVEAVQAPVPNQAAVIFGQVPNVDPARAIPVTAESKLPMDDTPQGFRRTSRMEGDGTYLKKDGVPPPTNPSFFVAAAGSKAPPGRNAGEVLPAPAPPKKAAAPNPVAPTPAPAPTQPKVAPKQPTEMDTHGIVPVEQRVVDHNGKSVYLADVEIVDLSSGEQISKSRTNGTGKWMAALPIGQYRVTIKKLESLTRARVENIQTVTVDGSQSPLKLPMVIIK